MTNQRHCRHCAAELVIPVNWSSANEFHRNYVCRLCANERNREWREANKSRLRHYDQPERRAKHLEYKRQWRLANRDRLRQYEKSPERRATKAQRNRRWRAKQPSWLDKALAENATTYSLNTDWNENASDRTAV